MRMRTVRYGTAPYYGTGARADAGVTHKGRTRRQQLNHRDGLDFQIIWKGKIAIIIVTKANPCVKCQKTFSSAFLP
jgi:hypothetical protein